MSVLYGMYGRSASEEGVISSLKNICKSNSRVQEEALLLLLLRGRRERSQIEDGTVQLVQVASGRGSHCRARARRSGR